MVTVETVERRIGAIEGFDVVFRHENGSNVHSNKEGFPQYRYHSRANDSWTVAEWKSNRFMQQYAGLSVDVLRGDGTVAAGMMILSTVRDSYR